MKNTKKQMQTASSVKVKKATPKKNINDKTPKIKTKLKSSKRKKLQVVNYGRIWPYIDE